jgi:hypothetical protein
MGQVAVVAMSFLAFTLALAGLGKLHSGKSPWRIPIAGVEVSVAGSLVVSKSLGAPLACLTLTTTFLIFATLDRSKTCECFGQHIPSGYQRDRVIRNALLVAASALLLECYAVGAPPMVDVSHALDVMVGVSLAALLILRPLLERALLGDGFD